jgi:hypothetical protein
MHQRNREQFITQGTWKKLDAYPNARPICMQMVVAKPIKLPQTKFSKGAYPLAGVVGGYCGSDLFVMEQFFAKTDKNNKITSLWIGSQDATNGQEIDFCSLDEHILDTCHQALQESWEWNSENNWLEAQQLRLYPYCLEGLKHNQGMLDTPKEKLLTNILKIAAPHLGLVSAAPKKSKNPKNPKESKKGSTKSAKDKLAEGQGLNL